MFDIGNIGHWASIVAIISFLLIWIPKVRTGVKWMWSKTFGRRSAVVNEILAQLTRIEHRVNSELCTNGGGSIKDLIIENKEHNQKMEAFLRAQLNIYNTAIIRTDARGKLFAINRQYQHLTGRSLEEVQGDGWVNVIHPSDRDKIKELWEEAVKNQREFIEDIRFMNTKGECFPIHAQVYRELDANNNVHGYLGVITPICKDNCPWRDSGCDLKCVYRASSRYLLSQDAVDLD